MLNIRHRSVNVNRLDLLNKLRENLEIHRKDFQEAVQGYKVKLSKDLQKALQYVNSTEAPELKNMIPVQFSFPVNYEQQYLDVIEMLEMSVDETIELDGESFKAYVKNEWAWSNAFNITATMYKSFNSSQQ